MEGGRTEEGCWRERNTDRIDGEGISWRWNGQAGNGGARAGRGMGWRLVWHTEPCVRVKSKLTQISPTQSRFNNLITPRRQSHSTLARCTNTAAVLDSSPFWQYFPADFLEHASLSRSPATSTASDDDMLSRTALRSASRAIQRRAASTESANTPKIEPSVPRKSYTPFYLVAGAAAMIGGYYSLSNKVISRQSPIAR